MQGAWRNGLLMEPTTRYEEYRCAASVYGPYASCSMVDTEKSAVQQHPELHMC